MLRKGWRVRRRRGITMTEKSVVVKENGKRVWMATLIATTSV
jgi:hypothetical protein